MSSEKHVLEHDGARALRARTIWEPTATVINRRHWLTCVSTAREFSNWNTTADHRGFHRLKGGVVAAMDVQGFGRRQENGSGKVKKMLGVDRTAWDKTLWESH